ncbi:hypothetical protein ACQKWADRAFT_71729 [Trichoderma austrokoningii]
MYICATAQQTYEFVLYQALEAFNKQWRLGKRANDTRRRPSTEKPKSTLVRAMCSRYDNRHCPRSGARDSAACTPSHRLSLVQASNRLSSPASLCGTRTREWPEFCCILTVVRNSIKQDPTSFSDWAGALESQRGQGKTASRSSVHSAAASPSPVLQLWPSPAWLPPVSGWRLSYFRQGGGSWAAANAMAAFCLHGWAGLASSFGPQMTFFLRLAVAHASSFLSTLLVCFWWFSPTTQIAAIWRLSDLLLIYYLDIQQAIHLLLKKEREKEAGPCVFAPHDLRE